MFLSLTILLIFNLHYQYKTCLIYCLCCEMAINVFLKVLLTAISNAIVTNKKTSKI